MISILIFIIKNNGNKSLALKDLRLSSKKPKDMALVPVNVNYY